MRKLSIKWLVLLAAALIYIAIGLIFFSVQNWEQCLSKFTGNACSMGQMMPVVLLPVGLIVLIGLFVMEPMYAEETEKTESSFSN